MASPSIRGNDYGTLSVPEGDWSPRLSVSVVIPAHGGQERLDVVLAALAAQTYPEELLEVVVVDDASDPPLRLPELRPAHTRIVDPLPGGWASAHATNSGVERSDGDVVLRLDSDMLAWADHVEAQMRWHHTADYLAVLGHKRFVDYQAGDLDPGEVHKAVAGGRAAELFDRDASEPQWIESIIDRTDRLRDSDHRAFRVLVGATFSVHRSLYKTSGGMDADVILGSDTIFGYRLHQAGAVFVPDYASSSWHLGPRQIASRGQLAKHYRRPHIANRVPEVDLKRPRAKRSWDTPLAEVFIDAAEGTETCADRVLAGSVPDVRVALVGAWPEPLPERHAPLDDPDLELRLLAESFKGEGRVRLVASDERDPDVPYRIWLPAQARPGEDAVAAMVGFANEQRLGLLEVELEAGTARLERAAARARAEHLGVDIDAVWGFARITEGELVDAVSGTKKQPSSAADSGRGGVPLSAKLASRNFALGLRRRAGRALRRLGGS